MLFASESLAARIERAECRLLTDGIDAALTRRPDEEFPREAMGRVIGDMATAAGSVRYLARRENVPSGGASLRTFEGVAQLCGATTQPGSKSQQNVQRFGFELLYTRAVLVRDE